MLNQFRSIAHGFSTKVLLGLLVLSFAVWGVGDMVSSPGGNRVVATVGGDSIYIESYQAAVRREAESIRRSLGDKFTPEILKAFQPENRALKTLIQQSLLKQESKSEEVIPSDADIVKRIRANPNFQDGHGAFSKARLDSALKANHMSEKMYVERLRQDLASGLMVDTLSVSLPVPEIAVKTIYEAEEEQRGATIYVLNESLTGAPSSPPEGAVEDYYRRHPQAFTAPESRTVSYVVVKPEAAKNQAKISEDMLLAAYKERIDEFKRPEQRSVDQLLFSSEADAKKASDALTAGKKFDEVAKAAPILNQGNISLGKVTEDRMLEAAVEEVFGLPKDGVTKPIQSPFGWHIFHVRAIELPSTAPLSDVRAQLEKDMKQQLEDDSQNAYLNKLEDTLAGGATLQEAAKEFGLSVQTVGPIVRSGKSPSGGNVSLPELDKFLDTAFATQEKSESPLVHAKNGSFYILRVDSVSPDRVRSLNEVRAEVRSAWQKETQTKRLGEIADDVAKKMVDKNTRNEVIRKYGLSPAFTGSFKRSADKAGNLSLPPALVVDLFRRAPGESTNAYALFSGGFMIAIAGNRIAAPPMSEKAAEPIRKSLEEAVNKEVIEEYLRHLERKHPVDINESLLQTINQQAGE